MIERRSRRRTGDAGSEHATFDVAGELVRVSEDDVRAGVLTRFAFTSRPIIVGGVVATTLIAVVFSRIAPWWQISLFVVTRIATAIGSQRIARSTARIGPKEALDRGYLLGVELWFAAVALSWSWVIFLAPSPLLDRPASVLALLSVIAVEGVWASVATISRRAIVFVGLAFWSTLTLRVLLDHGDSSRGAFLIWIVLFQLVLTTHALNLQRSNDRSVRSEVLNSMLLDRVTHLHSTLSRQRDELARVNAQLGAALEQSTELANNDSLTGALNRRAFLGRVAQETDGMHRHRRSSAVVLLDLDGFKSVNDDHGHAVGDGVLAACSLVLRSEMRASDVFARWGGEEFIVLLPGTSTSEATACAERYRLAIAQATSATWPTGLRVTASFGVAELPHDVDFDEALAAADRALYRAKHEGRNTVCVAPTTARPS